MSVRVWLPPPPPGGASHPLGLGVAVQNPPPGVKRWRATTLRGRG